MYRVVIAKCVFVCGVIAMVAAYGSACGDPPKTEPPPADAAVTPEARPEPPPVREAEPDVASQPAGVGDTCRISPIGAQGTCPNNKLLCGGVSSSDSICFENCTNTNICALKEESCLTITELSKFPVCVKVAKKDEPCGLDKRTVCPGESASPALYCVKGTCQERPTDGWDVGQACTPPRSDPKSDCKDGMLCIEHAKNVYICAKSCTETKDCPSGEECNDTFLPAKVCIIPIKPGDACDKLQRKFCKTDNPLNPAECKEGKCEAKNKLGQLGDPCQKSSQPGEERGNCDNGLLCLGVSDRASLCHKACTATSDCPSGESCITHPNEGPGDPLKACVIEVGEGKVCDTQERKFCKQEATQFYKCLRPDETKTPGTCTKVSIGDGCKNDNDCGRMLCIQIDPQNNPTQKYCLVACDPKAPQCPDNGSCNNWGMMGPYACIPTGPKQNDEACTGLQAVGDKLNTASLCTGGGLTCVTVEQGKGGICMKRVAQCAADSCDSEHVCLPSDQIGLCGRDCSKSPTTCKPGTTCVEIASLKAKVCASAM